MIGYLLICALAIAITDCQPDVASTVLAVPGDHSTPYNCLQAIEVYAAELVANGMVLDDEREYVKGVCTKPSLPKNRA